LSNQQTLTVNRYGAGAYVTRRSCHLEAGRGQRIVRRSSRAVEERRDPSTAGAHRPGSRDALAVAYVDVVGLKAVNDSRGHGAGDALLQRAVDGIRGHLRSYELIVRLGGGEFLCVMSGATIKDAEHRFNVIQTALAADSGPCEIQGWICSA